MVQPEVDVPLTSQRTEHLNAGRRDPGRAEDRERRPGPDPLARLLQQLGRRTRADLFAQSPPELALAGETVRQGVAVALLVASHLPGVDHLRPSSGVAFDQPRQLAGDRVPPAIVAA